MLSCVLTFSLARNWNSDNFQNGIDTSLYLVIWIMPVILHQAAASASESKWLINVTEMKVGNDAVYIYLSYYSGN